MGKIAQNRRFQHVYRCIAIERIRRDTKHTPPHKCSCIVFVNISEKALWSCVPSSCPYTAFYFEGYFVLWYCVIKPPHTFRVEAIFFDTLNAQVGFAYNREDINYFLLICRLSAFLLRLVCLFAHCFIV